MGKKYIFILLFLNFSFMVSAQETNKLKVSLEKLFSIALIGRDWVYDNSKGEEEVKLVKISDYDDIQVFTFSVKKEGDFKLVFNENNFFKKQEDRAQKSFIITSEKDGQEDETQKISGLNKDLNIKNKIDEEALKESNKMKELIKKENESIASVNDSFKKSLTPKIKKPKNKPKPVVKKPVEKKVEPKKEVEKELKKEDVEKLILKKQEDNNIEDKNSKITFKILKDNDNDKDLQKDEEDYIDDWFIDGISKELSKEVQNKIEAVINASRDLEQTDEDEALRLYEKLLQNYPFYKRIDEVYYRLGNIYEKSGINQNLVRAKEMYEAIVKRFSLSLHFVDAAKKVKYFKQFYNI